jgi:hypothetical protein
LVGLPEAWPTDCVAACGQADVLPATERQPVCFGTGETRYSCLKAIEEEADVSEPIAIDLGTLIDLLSAGQKHHGERGGGTC